MGRKSGDHLRVAFFGLLPVDSAPTRFFCERPAKELVQFDIDGILFPPSSVKLYRALYRRRSRGWQLRAAIYWYLLVVPRRIGQILRATRCDVVLVQRGLLRYNSPPLLELLLKLIVGRLAGRPIVYHLDDALWLVSRRSYYRVRCRIADRLITGNRVIAEFGRQAGARTTNIPWPVDVPSYPAKQHSAKRPVVIGYTGTAPEQYVRLVARPLREVCDSTGARVLVIGGDRPPEVPELEGHIEWRLWTRERSYRQFLDFDIGIMPFADTELNRGREPFKVKEYMAAGLPLVTSPVGQNLELIAHGVQGFFAASDEEWVRYLSRLVGSPPLRAEMGMRGRELMSTRYDYGTMLRSLAQTFREVTSGRMSG
jgi:glycosyltransferase involved in cell wall biosynthesis